MSGLFIGSINGNASLRFPQDWREFMGIGGSLNQPLPNSQVDNDARDVYREYVTTIGVPEIRRLMYFAVVDGHFPAFQLSENTGSLTLAYDQFRSYCNRFSPRVAASLPEIGEVIRGRRDRENLNAMPCALTEWFMQELDEVLWEIGFSARDCAFSFWSESTEADKVSVRECAETMRYFLNAGGVGFNFHEIAVRILEPELIPGLPRQQIVGFFRRFFCAEVEELFGVETNWFARVFVESIVARLNIQW